MKKAQEKKPQRDSDVITIEPIEEYKYNVWMYFNGAACSMNCNDVAEAILSVKPEVVFTELYIKISSENMSLEREFSINQAKRLFNNGDNLDIFTKNLLF